MTIPSPTLVEEPGPDERARAAAVVRQGLDRVLWQRLEVRDGELHAIVCGTRRRRPHELHVGSAAALGLLDQGVPTVGPSVGIRS